MELVALVTLLLLVEYVVIMMNVGRCRVKYGIEAPAVTGHEMFERAYRVQLNTVEQMIIALPAMWICAMFFSPVVAAVLGSLFLLGRALFAVLYMRDPGSRAPGMIIGFFGNVGNIACGLWGVITAFLA